MLIEGGTKLFAKVLRFSKVASKVYLVVLTS